MGILNINQSSIHTYSGDSIAILGHFGDVKMTFLDLGTFITDDSSYIDTFCRKIKTMDFDSVLIGGLGLGILAHWIDTNTSCSKIDVIENNSEIITWVSESNHLSSNINIIEGDAYTYNITSSYDLILMDLWWDGDGTYETEENNLITKYSGSLNSSGSLYFPISPTQVLNSGSI